MICLERFKKYCSHSEKKKWQAVFLVFGVVSAQSQGFQHAPSPKPRQKTKNPRSERPHYFLKRSNKSNPARRMDGKKAVSPGHQRRRNRYFAKEIRPENLND